MTDVRKLLEITPETLALQQYTALLEATAQRLTKLQYHIMHGELNSAQEMLFHSPAGDGHGSDNQCIKFTDLLPHHVFNEEEADIGDVLRKLTSLLMVINTGKKK